MRRTVTGMVLLVVGLAASCVPTKANVPREETDPRTPVEVMEVGVGTLVERGSYFGTLEPLQAVRVSAEVGGQVKQVTVDEGSVIGPGALLLAMDEEPFRLAEAQATQALAGARIRVEQLEKSIEMERKSLDAGVKQAEAALDAAKARMRLVETGARPEEKKQSRAGRDAARVAVDSARIELDRVRSLFDDGAATRQMLDGATTQLDAAQARFDQAEQIYRITVKGAREEDKDATRAAVMQAEAALSRAKAGLDSLGIREKELEAARIQVRSVELQLEQVQLNRSKATVESPLDRPARVAMRNIDPGEMAAPGIPLFELLDLETMRLVLQVPASEVGYLKESSKVVVECVGVGETETKRTATVRYVGIQAHAQNTTFPVELELPNGDGKLRSGQICEAFPELAQHRRPLVPREVVLDTEEGKIVMIVEEGRAREAPVSLAAVRKGIAAVAEGLEGKARVIVVGERLVKDGEEVNVVATQPPVQVPVEGKE